MNENIPSEACTESSLVQVFNLTHWLVLEFCV